MNSNQIVVIGSCNVDLVSYAPRLPNPGETIHGTKFVTQFGGKGANQCVAAAKLGGSTAMIARVGDDIWGDKFVGSLRDCNINTDHIQITENSTTGTAQIIVSAETGQNQIVITSGANEKLVIDDIIKSKDIVTTAGGVVMQLETSQDVAIKAMELCSGISILNGAPGQVHYNQDLLTLPTIFCVNETEASIFTGGLQVSNLSEIEKAALNLLTKGCNSVIITLGENGAYYMDKSNKFHVNCPSVKSVDTTGAGDVFIGALAYLLVNNKNIEIRKAIEKACLAATDSVTRLGTWNSFPNQSIFCDANR